LLHWNTSSLKAALSSALFSNAHRLASNRQSSQVCCRNEQAPHPKACSLVHGRGHGQNKSRQQSKVFVFVPCSPAVRQRLIYRS
jgi:hypothetical protein